MTEQQQQQREDSPRAQKPAGDDNRQISFIAILFFVLCIAVTATLIIAAAVMWFADIVGSVALSCLVFGAAAALSALIIYLLSVRRSVEVMHEYLETVYDTSRMVRGGYERVKAWFMLIFD